jgi:hypothetical protein
MKNESSSSNLIKVKIAHLIRFASSFKGIEVHVFVDNKFIKMNYSTDQFMDILRRLQQKDIQEVYITDVDCTRIMEEIQKNLTSKHFYDPSTLDEDRINIAEQSFEIVKEFIKQMDINKQCVDILNDVNQKTINILNESPSIFMLLNRYKKNCSEEFLNAILTSYLTSRVIDQFAWGSIQIKEKTVLASLLCDINLNKGDFKAIKNYELHGGYLEDRIKNHPLEISKLLSTKRDIIPTETITIVEQHHEVPDGSGFPYGIQSGRFNQLSCIFIVCQKFIEYLVQEKFDYSKRLEIIERIQKKYSCKTFDKSISALIKVVY